MTSAHKIACGPHSYDATNYYDSMNYSYKYKYDYDYNYMNDHSDQFDCNDQLNYNHELAHAVMYWKMRAVAAEGVIDDDYQYWKRIAVETKQEFDAYIAANHVGTMLSENDRLHNENKGLREFISLLIMAIGIIPVAPKNFGQVRRELNI